MYCRQKITKSSPSSEVSLQDMFEDDVDEHLIRKSLEICELLSLIDKLGGIDKPIGDAVSGGELQRLAIALHIGKAFDREALIIDEPEQGSDLELAIDMLKRIFENLGEKIIIIVLHLPVSYLTENGIIFNRHLKIIKGCIT